MYMTYTLTVTSQGQVTIPAELRRLWNLMKRGQITITLQGKKAVVEPARDLLDYVGVFNKYAKKGMIANQVIKMEEDAVAEAAAGNYLRKQRRSGNKLVGIKTW